MAPSRRRIAVSIPDTVLEEKESQRDKTTKLGLIARACAIHGVEVIEVFRDPKGKGEAPLIERVLEYLETPQYLRRRIFPLDEALKFAGLLPPLRIPSHKPKVPFENVAAREVREGVTNDDGTVDVGLDVAPKLREKLPAGQRVTVRFTSTKPPVAEAIRKTDAVAYWGYTVEQKSLHEVLSDARFGVKIATSRLGEPLLEALPRIRASLAGIDTVKLIFGSPSRGLFDMVGTQLERRVDFVINLFPQQHVETVRTEEAIFAGLGLVSLISAEKA